MTFWTESSLSPTRQFRFKVSSGADWWWVSSCSKPSYDINTEEYKLINHKYKYPGVVTWNDVTITVVDIGKTAKGLYDSLFNGGWNPKNSGFVLDGMDKRNMSSVLETMQKGDASAMNPVDFKIMQLDDEGAAIEIWTLVNPFIKSTNFGELDYSSDDLVKLELVISYDYAELN